MSPHLTTAPGQIHFRIGDARVASYRTEGGAPGFSALFAAGLRAVTDTGSAAGQGVWIAHGNVNSAAFGAASPGFSDGGRSDGGRIETRELVVRRGSQSVGFRHTCDWVAAGERVLTETRTVRLTSGPSAGALLDIDLVLTPSGESSVTLGRSAFGLLCARIAAPLLPDAGGQVRNSNDEFGPDAINGRQAAWCACNGVVDGETVGVAILDHPTNPWHPSPWVCTEGGLLSPSPFPWRTHELTLQAPLRLRYRLVVHSGYVEAGWVHQRLRDWSQTG